MSQPWPMVPLGEVVSKSDEWTDLKADGIYREVTVRLWGKGVVQRREVVGAEIAATRRMLVRTNQLILSRIDARNGAAGIIPAELDGAVVSNDFPVFNLNTARVEPKYFGWFTKTHNFVEICKAASEGTTNRVRLQEERFLSVSILLPPLSEQKRIVARLEELAAKVEVARALRREAVEQSRTLLNSTRMEVFSKIKGVITKKLDEVAFINMGQSPPGHSYNNHGEGIPLLNGPTEFGDIHPMAVQWTISPTKFCKTGDILLCVRGATTGRTNWADKEYCIGRGLAALTANKNSCSSEYVYHFVMTQVQQMLALSAGSTFPNLSGAKLKSLGIPIPPLSDQRRIVAYFDGLQAKVDELKRLQAESSAELDAMLPSILDLAFKGGLHTREALSHISSVQIKQGLGTMLEEYSSKTPVAGFPAIYPATDTDRAVCAASLSIVEQYGAISSKEHLDALLLVTHPDMCKNLLGQKERRSLATAMKSAPKELFAGKGEPIRWKECRDYLEALGAITIARGTYDQFIRPGMAFASIKAGLPAGTNGMAKYALSAIEHVRELRKNLASAPQEQRKALRVLDKYHEENKIPA